MKKTTPQKQTKKENPTFNVFQANVSGLNRKQTDLQKLFHDHNVHVALLQEAQHKSCNTNISGYTPYTCNCENCRGIVTYVRNDLQCNVTEHTEDSPNDILLATVWFGLRKFKIYNIYSPPKVDFSFTTEEVIFKSTILFWDFNGHSPLWGYRDHNPSGLHIEQLCDSSNLIRLQDENSPPTLLHKAHGTSHRPDLTLVSADIQPDCSFEVLRDIGSDHLPNLLKISVTRQYNRKRRSRWNFRKAKWDVFQNEMDKLLDLQELDNMNENDANSHICKAILSAANSSIPRGSMKQYKPFWNQNLDEAVKARNNARQIYIENNTPENRTQYHKLSAETKLLIKNSKNKAWHDKCEGLNLHEGGREAWNLLQNMSGNNKK